MNYRRLGKTNLQLSEIGMGTWQITDDPDWGKGNSEKDSFDLLQRFIDLGGNHIDTAWAYGWSDDKPLIHPSEELIGKFLKNTHQRDKVVLVTKIPPINHLWPAPENSTMASTFPKQHIIDCVEDSLRSLQTDSLEVMLFHVWRDIFNEEEEWKEVCKKLTKEGKVQYWGISPNYFEPEECINTLNEGFISVVQCMFHIFHQKPIKTLFPITKKNDVGIVACAPLDEGGLTGSITLDTIFEAGDFRADYFAGDRLPELVNRTDKLKELLGENDLSNLAELALRFILSFKEVSSVIPGMRKMKNLESNVAVSDGKILTQKLIEKLEDHTWERNFYPWASD